MRKYKVVLLLLIISVTMISCYVGPRVMQTRRGPLYGRKILLDPGHGLKNKAGININSGMYGPGGIHEQVLVVDIAETLGQLLQDAGCTVYYTRNKEKFWRIYEDVKGDNYNRSFEARDLGVDAFIKIHLDWYKDKKVSGTRTFYFKRNSKKLAKYIHKSLTKTINRTNRGIEREWYVGMEVAQMPSVLVEICFISNQEEAALLKDQGFLYQCAEGMYHGIISYFKRS